MADPIRIPLSPYHVAQLERFAQREQQATAQLKRIEDERNLVVATLMGAHFPPDHTVWSTGNAEIQPDAIVVTIPAATGDG
jgi:hypothetical protein